MTRSPLTIACLLVTAVAATFAARTYSRQDVSTRPVAPRPYGLMPAPEGIHTPAISCAAASCHNANQPGHVGSEYTTFVNGDPHRKAFPILFNEDSVRIMKNLSMGEPGKWGTKAHKEALCLKCHSIDSEKYFHGQVIEDRNVTEGVGCDACHGPSKVWLDAHYQPLWKTLTNQQKYEQYKFIPTKDLVSRSLVCAGCHVGQSDREVNHDLIAAGHPRLSFEYTRYHFQPQYKKHWEEPLPNSSFEMKAWLVGQVTALRQAIDLLGNRAERAAAKSAPWPELSEASCYSCHQGIGGVSRSAGSDRRNRKPGVPGWQVWYSSLTDLLPAASAVILPEARMDSLTNLAALRREMESPTSDPARVVALAATARAELDAWLIRVQAAGSGSLLTSDAGPALGALVTESVLSSDRTRLRDYDWDYLAQHTLALTAAYHAAGGETGTLASWKEPLSELRLGLSFKSNSERRFDSPKDFDTRAALARFQTIYNLTHSGKGER